MFLKVLESLFYKSLSLQACNVTKKDSYIGVFLWNLRNSEEHLFWRASERLLLCIDYFIYSSLPNRRGARNKRGGGKDEPFLISVVPGISMVVRVFRPVAAIKRRKKMN